jgi:hypothetical protein
LKASLWLLRILEVFLSSTRRLASHRNRYLT